MVAMQISKRAIMFTQQLTFVSSGLRSVLISNCIMTVQWQGSPLSIDEQSVVIHYWGSYIQKMPDEILALITLIIEIKGTTTFEKRFGAFNH